MKAGKPMQIGEKYGRLTVESYLYTDAHPRRYFLCRCECGGEVVTHTNSLRTGNTRSCGCLLRDTQAASASQATTRRLQRSFLGISATQLGGGMSGGFLANRL